MKLKKWFLMRKKRDAVASQPQPQESSLTATSAVRTTTNTNTNTNTQTPSFEEHTQPNLEQRPYVSSSASRPFPFARRKEFRSFQKKANVGLYEYFCSSLHVACIEGLSPDIVSWILAEHGHQALSETDINGKSPLHYTIMGIFGNKMSLANGLKIIQMICSIKSSLINNVDKEGKAPLDLVHDARNAHVKSESSNGSSEETLERKSTIDTLNVFLRELSVAHYRRQKKQWEEGGYQIHFPDSSSASMVTLNGETVGSDGDTLTMACTTACESG